MLFSQFHCSIMRHTSGIGVGPQFISLMPVTSFSSTSKGRKHKVFRKIPMARRQVAGSASQHGCCFARGPSWGVALPSHRSEAGGSRSACIVWFRNDLRLDDNEALLQANSHGSSLLPVYCFDPRDYGRCAQGFERTGINRARFLLESVADLRRRLQSQGSELLVRVGKPEEVIPTLAAQCGASRVYCQTEATAAELEIELAVKRSVESQGATELHALWGCTLHHPRDLPFALQDVPTAYGVFKEAVSTVRVRPPEDSPAGLKGLPQGLTQPAGSLPTLKDLGFESTCSDSHAHAKYVVGGETEASRSIACFLSSSAVVMGKQQGGGCASTSSAAFSQRIAPWLAAGCVSARRLYQHIQQHLQPHANSAAGFSGRNTPNGTGQWLTFELLFRDFFRLMSRSQAMRAVQADKGGCSISRQHAVLPI